MKIIITGCSGQIGNALLTRLFEANFAAEIYGIDIQPPKYLEFKHKRMLNYIQADLKSNKQISSIEAHIKTADHVIHLASSIENSRDISSISNLIKADVEPTINLISLMKENANFIYASSMMIYGQPRDFPIVEEHPKNPENIYGICKLYTELVLNDLRARHLGNITSLRLSGIYGTGKYSGDSLKRAIPTFIRRLKMGLSPIISSHPHEKRDYLFIDDAVSAIICSIINPYNGCLNIGSGSSISISRLAEILCSIVDENLNPEHHYDMNSRNNDEMRLDYLLDITKAQKHITYNPKVNIFEGLKIEVDRYG
jgi:nucleoside-diphosphate-sugar epimerase